MKYKFKTTPYVHQRKALRKLFSNEYGGALLMEPRTGKSKVIIDWLCALNMAGRVDKVLIIAPTSVLRVWRDELALHATVKFMTILWDKEGREEISLPDEVSRLTIVLVNYEAFATADPKGKGGAHRKNRRRKKGVKGKTALKKALLAWKPDAMVLDESHKIKSPSAKRTVTIHRVAWIQHRKPRPDGSMRTELVPYRAIATGTAVTKKRRVYDVYSQWKFLNPDRLDEFDVATFSDFKSRFVREKDREGYKQWLRNLDPEGLRRLVHSDAYSITRAECFDLPPRTDQIVRVALDDNTLRIYDELAEHMIADIETEKERARRARKEGRPRKEWKVTASIPLVAILRLSQLTSGVAKITDPETNEERIIRVSEEKIKICKDLLDNEWESDQKVVVAARFRPDLAAVQRLGTRTSGVRTWRISGGVSSYDRHLSIKQFAAHQGPGLMIVQPQSAALGIDLSAASTMIWFSLTPSYVDFSQTCDRIALSQTPTNYKYLLAEGTYDEDLYRTLQEDEDVVKEVTRSPERLRRSGTM